METPPTLHTLTLIPRAGMQLSQVLNEEQRKERFSSSNRRKRMIAGELEGVEESPLDMSLSHNFPQSATPLNLSPRDREQSTSSEQEQFQARLNASRSDRWSSHTNASPEEQSASRDRDYGSLLTPKVEPQMVHYPPWLRPAFSEASSSQPPPLMPVPRASFSPPGISDFLEIYHRAQTSSCQPLIGRPPQSPEVTSAPLNRFQNAPNFPIPNNLLARLYQENPMFPFNRASECLQSAAETSDFAQALPEAIPVSPSPRSLGDTIGMLHQRQSVIQIARNSASTSSSEGNNCSVTYTSKVPRFMAKPAHSTSKEISPSRANSDHSSNVHVETVGTEALEEPSQFIEKFEQNSVIMKYMHKKFNRKLSPETTVRKGVIRETSKWSPNTLSAGQDFGENGGVDHSDSMDLEDISLLIELEDIDRSVIQNIQALCISYLMEEAPYMEIGRTAFFNAWRGINMGDSVMHAYIEFAKTRINVPMCWMRLVGKQMR